MSDTIAALSSGVGKAAVAVVRVSGPATRFAVETLCGSVPRDRRAEVRTLRRGALGEVIDQAMVLFFEGPRSFTGQDMAEFQIHGGRAVVAALLDELFRLDGVRPALPGEFTRRAVDNGKLDLTAAEGIADLIEAETAGQRRQALRQAAGALERAAGAWRDGLVEMLALVEAQIDFPDEGDVPELLEDVRARATRLLSSVESALASSRRGERVRAGAVVVIAGPPNAGKSTLLNAIARRDVAIVSPFAGTTRDTIEVHLDLDGFAVTLVDTAGMRDTVDPVEAMGVDRAKAAADGADLVLWLSPADRPARPPCAKTDLILVTTKSDLIEGGAIDSGAQPIEGVRVSALSGRGMESLIEAIGARVKVLLDGAEDALVTRARHRVELAHVADSLRRVISTDPDVPIEFIGEDLRLCVRGIGRLTGRVDIDEIYDVIFSSFCIGK
jgi:tRNA modification GTPase